MGFKDRIARFMYGRYGTDQLGMFILALSLAVVIVSLFFRDSFVYFILLSVNILLAVLYFLRVFSRKTDKRAAENRVFLKILTKIKEFFIRQFNRVRYIGKYRYRKCKNCKAFLRLPNKKGKHTVRCPKCGNSFSINIII